MKIEQINPYVRYIDKRNKIKSYKDFVYAYDHRIFYVERGEIQIETGGEIFTVRENSMMIIGPATPYKLIVGDNYLFTVLNFDLEMGNPIDYGIMPHTAKFFNRENVTSFASCDIFPCLFSCSENARELIAKITDVFFSKRDYSVGMVSALLKELIVSSVITTISDTSPELIKSLKQYIYANYMRQITNEELGKAFSYHPNYLNKVFKGCMGMSIHKYLNTVRVEEALKLILNGESVSAVTEKCGFSSTAYFIKKFREHYGTSPLKYRKERNHNLL